MFPGMDLSNKEFLYKIVCARDKRYDGRFYCGVHTTGIYCRPICPARPKMENISFYRSAAEAEKQGYRACLRCRPDLAPNSVQWNGTAAVVGRALSLISQGEADSVSLDRFAEKLGVSDRHLRRLFDEHVGASPIEVATSKRLHLAKQLLMQSNLTITDVAFASGYQSIRRFNEVFKERFKAPPSSVRKSKRSETSELSNFIEIDLPVIAPFDWDHLLGFLKNHFAEGVESIVENRYRRSFSINKATGALEITYDSKREQLSAKVYLSDTTYLRTAIEKIRDLFDVRLNPHTHLGDLSRRDTIANCYIESIGLRIPGAWDPFETAISIILGQLVSVEQARLKIKKLVARFGKKISEPMYEECTHHFPEPRILANADFREIGITKARENAIKELSKLVMGNRIDLSRTGDLEKTKAQLLEIKGIGPWTTEMIAMRCMGDTNAFPTTDLIIKRALEQHKIKKGEWSPWNAYITLALWKKYAINLSRKSKKRSGPK